jgi:hypothetical protein
MPCTGIKLSKMVVKNRLRRRVAESEKFFNRKIFVLFFITILRLHFKN